MNKIVTNHRDRSADPQYLRFIHGTSVLSNNNHYDVIIIGSGAGGGTLALHLAPSGKRVLLLERGAFLPREKSNWDSNELFVKKRYVSDKLIDRGDKEIWPELYYYVGGNTKMYGAVLARFRKEDFGEVVHKGGVSPAWPLGYGDFESYYTNAEDLYHVHGERDCDPTEPEASRPYPYPPISHEPRIQELADGLTAAGYHPQHLPIGLKLDEANPHESLCIRCDTCAGYPCMVHAKADAEIIAVRPAVTFPNVTLMTDAHVTKLETSPSGREVTSVVIQRNGAIESFSADIIVLAAGACNTAKLLLLSANDKHPNGLANSSDQVGRNFVLHHRSAMVCFFPRKNPTRFQMTLGLNDFYHGCDEFEYPMGRVQTMVMMKSAMFQSHGPVPAPDFVLEGLANRSIAFLLTAEDLADPDNRLTVTASGDMKLSYVPNNTEGIRALEKKMKSVIADLGRGKGLLNRGISVVQPVSLEGLGHQAGTCRLGIDPETSVVEINCKAHDLDNLYVADASFFPNIGACNPTLTIIANAMRVGDHILERLGASPRRY